MKHLDRNETPYVHKDATTEESLSFISGLDAGYRAAPVVVVFEDGVIVDHWSGYNPDAINTLVI